LHPISTEEEKTRKKGKLSRQRKILLTLIKENNPL
jgi:hypothetical protein